MAFSFSSFVDHSEDVFGLLGLKTDDNFLSSDLVDENKVLKFKVENEINGLVDYDSLTAEEQELVYNSSLFLLAGNLYKYYLPNALPKYMSSNKVVFDKYKNIDYRVMGEELLAEGYRLLETIIAANTAVGFLTTPLGTNPVTGETQ
jgi:hypothetical protein